MSDPLKDLKATYKRQEILLPDLERHVVRQAALPDDERRSDAMHPSDMAKSKWCPRRDYYRISGEPADHEPDPIGFRRANQFDYGHHIHRKYQRWFTEMGILWGFWECKTCGAGFLSKSPRYCQRCQSERLIYKEVPLDYPDLRINGHADGVVFLNTLLSTDPIVLDLEAVMIEIKSIGINSLRYEAYPLFEKYQQEQMTPDEAWFLIKRPFASHIRQGSMYLHLGRLLYPELHLERIVFIYEWKPTQEVKEFVITYSPDRIVGVLDGVDSVLDALDDDEPPSRPWASPNDNKGCGTCEYRGTCWGEPSPQSQAAPLRVRRAPAAQRRALRS